MQSHNIIYLLLQKSQNFINIFIIMIHFFLLYLKKFYLFFLVLRFFQNY